MLLLKIYLFRSKNYLLDFSYGKEHGISPTDPCTEFSLSTSTPAKLLKMYILGFSLILFVFKENSQSVLTRYTNKSMQLNMDLRKQWVFFVLKVALEIFL